MKNKWWFAILVSLAAGILLAAPSARAQFEIDPDHYFGYWRRFFPQSLC